MAFACRTVAVERADLDRRGSTDLIPTRPQPLQHIQHARTHAPTTITTRTHYPSPARAPPSHTPQHTPLTR